MISDRTGAALAAAKAHRNRPGGFHGRAGTAADCAKARRAKSLAAKSRAADLAPIIEDRCKFAAANCEGIEWTGDFRTSRFWSAAHVRAAMARILASR